MQELRYLFIGIIFFIYIRGYSQEQVYSTNDVNFTIAKRAYDEKNWALATGYFEKYIEGEESGKVHPTRENRLMQAYLYAGFCSEKAFRFENTIDHYESGIRLARKLNEPAYLKLMLNNVGMGYQRTGKFQKSISAHKEALKLNLKMKEINSAGVSYSNIAGAYLRWGDYSQALEYLEKAKEFYELGGNKRSAIRQDIDIGQIYIRWNQLDKAFNLLNETANKLIALGANPSSALMLLSEIYVEKSDFQAAEEKIKTAINYDRKTKNDKKIPDRLMGLGLVYFHQKKYEDALMIFEEGLSNARYLKDKEYTSSILSNIGAIYYEKANYTSAITYFEEAVLLKEELRSSAFGPIRREYLSSQIKTYKYLASCYMKTDKVAKTFEAIEAGRSKYLAEQIAKSSGEPEVLSLAETQKLLGKDDVALIYANADWREKLLIIITNNSIDGIILDDRSFIQNVVNLSKGKSKAETQSQRGSLTFIVAKMIGKEAVGVKEQNDIFEIAINYYRNFLIKRIPEERLSNYFYDLLIKPVQKHIASKKNLIISPDGLLNYLPFETLKSSGGEYLILSKNIRYTQSMGVLKVLNERNYSPDRKYMLAFGGSVYDEDTFKEKMKLPDDEVLPEEEFDGPIRIDTDLLSLLPGNSTDLLLKESLTAELDQNPKKSLRSTYKKLGITKMSNLPGTLYEIEHISKVVPDVEIYSLYRSNEFYIKYLNKNGSLANYKVLHLATHGLTVPVLPELSAVVLSIYKNERSEDGFLRTQEIHELNINADFVNLSACETGLGKIYGGEGVVGLTQSFLIAGANGLSVSLWSVDDRSTAIFMVEMYKKVNQDGMDYYEAIAETKREFIEGKHGAGFTKPYFWAPFVYYGRSQ
ncbi:CHAT domain-containing protein [Ekhidna sp.]|uniref:CHAT domain-containing protein n=1 Tax=Ekhidna sp. TaxID=2608089 RepID=UPI003B508C6D